MHFTVRSTEGNARAGELALAHGNVLTPAFMPVGTRASVKALSPHDLRDIDADIILSNTYHLSLRPGVEVVRRMGGLHAFMGWDRPILTDSGGFQVFSLGHMRRLTDDGVTFRSHIDGSQRSLTPEDAIAYQEGLGSDIAMVLDHCPAYGEDQAYIEEATSRTHLWAARCISARTLQAQAVFAIVQGGWSASLRQESAKYLARMDFDGYAIGGVSVGEPKELGYLAVDHAAPYLPMDKPRYLMGVGAPEDLLNGIARGIDLFDCSLPTRIARNGSLFTPTGRINIRNAQFETDKGIIDRTCDCYTCWNFSNAYLHHLLRAKELLYYRLATIHNVRFILRLMEHARVAILEGHFASFAQDFLKNYRTSNEEVRLAQKDRWLKARRIGAGRTG